MNRDSLLFTVQYTFSDKNRLKMIKLNIDLIIQRTRHAETSISSEISQF